MDLTSVSWRKASFSGDNGGGCVEVSMTADGSQADADLLCLVQDSKNPDGPKLAFTSTGWAAFVAGVKDGEFAVAE